MVMDKEKDKKEGDAPKQKPIIYLGHDLSYFEELKASFRKRFPEGPKTFLHQQREDQGRIQSLYSKILAANPQIILVDLSMSGKDYLQLTRLIIRINATKNVPVIAIFDKLSADLIPASVISGIKFNFPKTSDYYSITRAMMHSIKPEGLGEAELATAALNDKVKAYECCQIGFVTEDFMHIELEKKLKMDEVINIRTRLQTEKVVPSMQMELVETTDRSLFYNYPYNARLKFRYLDKIVPEDHPAKELEQLERERNNNVNSTKKRLKKWAVDNQTSVKEKYMRTLIYERDLSFLDREERTDSYDFLIRMHPYALDSKSEIRALLPQLIVFQFDSEDSEDKPLYPNDLDSLKKIVESVKSFDNYNPYIVVFNSYLASSSLQKQLNYPTIIAYDKMFGVEIMITIVTMIRAKLAGHFKKISELNPRFFKKDAAGSMAEIVFHAKLLKINEAEVIFETDYPLEANQVIHLEEPIHMYVTISHEALETPTMKKGFISGADELELNSLRRFINGVFFRDKELQKEEEKAAVENKKKEALRKKKQAVEDAKIAAEKAKKEKEEAENEETEKNKPAEDGADDPSSSEN